MRKICVITTTRAEYGQLFWVLKALEREPSFKLQLIVGGTHLSPEHGSTYKEIERDGFNIDAKVEMLLSSDTAVGIAKSMGLATVGFADALDRLKPDLLLVLGDRYEILAAVQAATIARIPIAHLCGGDTTEGVYDEAFRHSITKMSHLHFVTNEESASRVRQLGENPKHIYTVGNPALDQIRHLKPMKKSDLEKRLGFALKKKNILVTFHPVTLDQTPSEKQFDELLKGLKRLPSDVGILFTYPNAERGSHAISDRIDKFVEKHQNSRAYPALGFPLYLHAMAHVDAVVGNSSSGISEAPSFNVPTVNIGSRQQGRPQATSVQNCRPVASEISKAIQTAFRKNLSNVESPFGDGKSSEKIVRILRKATKIALKKPFFRVGEGV